MTDAQADCAEFCRLCLRLATQYPGELHVFEAIMREMWRTGSEMAEMRLVQGDGSKDAPFTPVWPAP